MVRKYDIISSLLYTSLNSLMGPNRGSVERLFLSDNPITCLTDIFATIRIVREPGVSIGTNFGSKAHSDF